MISLLCNSVSDIAGLASHIRVFFDRITYHHVPAFNFYLVVTNSILIFTSILQGNADSSNYFGIMQRIMFLISAVIIVVRKIV